MGRNGKTSISRKLEVGCLGIDGGQIFILMVEGVIRRDLSLRLKEIISQVGFVMILLLMFVVIWFDLMKSLPPSLRPGG